MDGKGTIIIILFVILITVAVFGIITYSDLQDTKKSIVSFKKQEEPYKNENRQSLQKNRYERYFRHENPHLYKHATRYNNRLFRKALLNFQTGQYKDALKNFTELKVDSLDTELSSAAYYYIAECLVNMNRDKKALLFLNKVVQILKPNTWTTKAIILQGEINRKYQFTNESLEVYLHKLYMETPISKERNEILTQIGYLKLFRDDLSGAISHFQKANTVLAQLGRARVHVKKNEYWKAISIYEDVLKHRNFKNLAYYKDVKKAFQKQTYYYARRWLNHKDYDHAYFYLRKIINFFPNSMYGEASLYWIGEIFYRRGLYRSAIKYYNLALSNGNRNKDAVAQFKKGMAWYKLKRYGSALRSFQRVRDFHRSSVYAKRAYQWTRMIERQFRYK